MLLIPGDAYAADNNHAADTHHAAQKVIILLTTGPAADS